MLKFFSCFFRSVTGASTARDGAASSMETMDPETKKKHLQRRLAIQAVNKRAEMNI
jgi:hypothetical protein